MGASHCSSASWLLGSEASAAGGFWRRSPSVLTGKPPCRPTSAGLVGRVWGGRSAHAALVARGARAPRADLGLPCPCSHCKTPSHPVKICCLFNLVRKKSQSSNDLTLSRDRAASDSNSGDSGGIGGGGTQSVAPGQVPLRCHCSEELHLLLLLDLLRVSGCPDALDLHWLPLAWGCSAVGLLGRVCILGASRHLPVAGFCSLTCPPFASPEKGSGKVPVP